MINFRSYTHSVMINYFEMMLIAIFAAITAYTINEVFGNVVHVCMALFLAYATFDSWRKIINPFNWDKNCWYKGGK